MKTMLKTSTLFHEFLGLSILVFFILAKGVASLPINSILPWAWILSGITREWGNTAGEESTWLCLGETRYALDPQTLILSILEDPVNRSKYTLQSKGKVVWVAGTDKASHTQRTVINEWSPACSALRKLKGHQETLTIIIRVKYLAVTSESRHKMKIFMKVSNSGRRSRNKKGELRRNRSGNVAHTRVCHNKTYYFI